MFNLKSLYFRSVFIEMYTRFENDARLKFDPKPLEAAFSAVFRTFGRCRPKAAGGVMSGVAVQQVGLDVRVQYGASKLNSGRIISLFAGRTRFTHFYAVFNCILQPTGNQQLATSYPAR